MRAPFSSNRHTFRHTGHVNWYTQGGAAGNCANGVPAKLPGRDPLPVDEVVAAVAPGLLPLHTITPESVSLDMLNLSRWSESPEPPLDDVVDEADELDETAVLGVE